MEPAETLWTQILELLEEKLQMGLLQQARSVTSARIDGNDLVLTASSAEAREFFSAHVNQQRLIILARSIANFERIRVEDKIETPS